MKASVIKRQLIMKSKSPGTWAYSIRQYCNREACIDQLLVSSQVLTSPELGFILQSGVNAGTLKNLECPVALTLALISVHSF